MTQSKIDIEKVTVTAKGRTLSSEWKFDDYIFEEPQEMISIHSEEAAEELGRIVAKEQGLKAWEDYLPGINDFHRMCEEYPALDSAFKKFKTAWDLVIDDWESKNDR